MSAQGDNLFKKLITRNIKAELRTPFNVSWLMALNKRARVIFDEFNAFRFAANRSMKRNGQKIIFEDILNKAFPEASGGITINTVQGNSELVFMGFGNTQDFGVYLGFEPGDGVYLGVPDAYVYDHDFTVNIPEGVVLNISRLRGLVLQYKLAGKRFIIKQGNQTLASGFTLTPSV